VGRSACGRVRRWPRRAVILGAAPPSAPPYRRFALPSHLSSLHMPGPDPSPPCSSTSPPTPPPSSRATLCRPAPSHLAHHRSPVGRLRAASARRATGGCFRRRRSTSTATGSTSTSPRPSARAAAASFLTTSSGPGLGWARRRWRRRWRRAGTCRWRTSASASRRGAALRACPHPPSPLASPQRRHLHPSPARYPLVSPLRPARPARAKSLSTRTGLTRVAQVQRGLESGAYRPGRYGAAEGPSFHFHRTLAQHI
jgi:hypothetical protein